MATTTWTTYDSNGNVVSTRTETTTPEHDNRESLRTQADQVIATLENATRTKATWDGLSAAQRQEFTRLGLLAIAKVARLVLGRLDAS